MVQPTRLCTDQNGSGSGSVAEIVIEARAAARILVATSTAIAPVAETNVRGGR